MRQLSKALDPLQICTAGDEQFPAHSKHLRRSRPADKNVCGQNKDNCEGMDGVSCYLPVF